MSALGAADDSWLLRFGMVLYTREGEYCVLYTIYIYYILCTVYVLCTVLYCSVLYSALYTTEGENLHGLHEKDSRLREMGFIDI